MDMHEQFRMECLKELERQGADKEARRLSDAWISYPGLNRYSYNFSWMGRPIIQYSQDIIAMQELVHTTQPDLIIETGIAHGGSLIFYASLLELNALCGCQQNFHVLGIDIDIRAHNREAIETHPIFRRGHITMFEGSSIETAMVERVQKFAAPYKRIMVLLDSNHTHDHVLAELEAYAPLVATGSYCVVFDTVVENMQADSFPDRPWGKGNNPMTAVNTYLAAHHEFVTDSIMDAKLLISVAPKGYLKRIA